MIRLLSGAERPTSGRIHREMRVSWPLAFTGAFQARLSGLDNLKFVCRVYGVDWKPLLPFVEEFTELGLYLREPVERYSTGMTMRLAFALSMAIEFDCFLIDEGLAVGDARFGHRCHVELFQKRKDRAFILVSHDPNIVKLYCKRACVLHDGRLYEFERIDDAYAFYESVRPAEPTSSSTERNHDSHLDRPESMMKILLELRPAFDGHAGIPQEARLLFRGLARLDDCTVEGLIQSSTRFLSKGLATPPRPLLPGRVDPALPEHRKLDRLSRVVVSLQNNPPRTRLGRLSRSLRLTLKHARVAVGTAAGMQTPLHRFDGTHFKDFVWRSMFARTLPPQDFDLVTSAGYRVVQMPWTGMHTIGLATKKLGAALYPRLDTRDFDVMIAETPYPGRVAPNTQMVVRYHDAIPLLLPHTIADRSYHQSSHY